MVSNVTDSDNDFVLGRPVVLGPAVAVACLLVILLGITVLLFARNRQARIARLRERIGLAESRVNALLRIQQMAEVKKGVNKQSSDGINKEKDESICDNDTTPSVKTSSIQQTKLSQSIDQPLTSASDCTATECYYRTHGSVGKCGVRKGHSGMGSSLESLDDASHVAVVDQSLYNSSTCQSYTNGEIRLVQNADYKRSNNLFSVLDQNGGYSSSQVEGWV